MSRIFRSFIRASSFLTKEFYEVLRQPRLIVSLVLGPFLILFLFGIGYRDQNRVLRTIFVIPKNAVISAQDIQKYSETIKSLIQIEGVTDNKNSALDQLRQGTIDMVIEEPEAAFSIIKNNHQAVFNVYHNEIDPVQIDYIDYLGWLYVGAVNQQVLQAFTSQGQKDAAKLHQDLRDAHANIAAAKKAIQTGDNATGQQKQQELTGNLDSISLLAGGTLGLLDSYQATDGGDTGSGDHVQTTLSDINQNTNVINNPATSPEDRLTRLDKIDKDLSDLDTKLGVVQNISPAVLVSPFSSLTRSVANYQPSLLSFFVPAVLALLLQHVAITFAALSIVRERNVGTVELFKISPISATEVLFGKYLSYMLFGGIIAAALALLMHFILHLPMWGNWWYFTLTVAVILFTSLGYGFVISIISQTDSQAVQYSMIFLLASVFFSGFIMGLEKLIGPVRIVSWMLPTTYGTILLRNIALRGLIPDWILLGGLAAIGVFLLFIAWLLMRRLIGSSAWSK
jgi:ABC-2 type transport system permease protein